MNNNEINARFKTAPWYETSKNERIIIAGLGGIGSYTAFFLAKTIPCTYYLFDADNVNTHNLGTQFFKKDENNKSKVECVTNRIYDYTTANPVSFNNFYEKCSGTTPIMISAFDNMESRKLMFNEWKSKDSRELFIDGRLRANYYEIYTVQKGQELEYEKTLFDSSEIEQDVCTFKQTAYFAGLIGARITHLVVNYLTNKYSEEPICELPFKVEEIGEPFIMNLETKPVNSNVEVKQD